MNRSEKPDADSARSSFIVYVDESGDHSLDKIDEAYPVFVLAFCVFYQENYVNNVVSAVERLKFRKFGHDMVILHERDIRKEIAPFVFKDKAEKDRFIGELSQIIADSKFILIAALIDKQLLRGHTELPENAYHMALGSCLEGLGQLLAEKGQQNRETHIVFERRGAKEDKDLELEFRRICDGANPARAKLPYRIVLADKKVNSAGLQLADLVARPIGLNYLRPAQANRAFAVLKEKFYCSGGREGVGQGYEGWGLRILPASKSEKPR
jgi:Protein of unknown function (DUF3800)